MNTFLKYYIAFCLLLGTFSLFAFDIQDDVVLNAMKIELDRSLEGLKKDSLANPFYISMLVKETDYEYRFSTSFGQKSEEEIDSVPSRSAYPLVLVGSYHRTQPFSSKNGSFSLPLGDDETAIRSGIWINLDGIYKKAALEYVDKMAWLKQENQTEEEKKLDDFEKRKATKLIRDIEKATYDFSVPKKYSIETGQLLYDLIKQQKLKVEDLTTRFWFSSQINRYYDTEGSFYKYPMQSGSFVISLSGVNEKGEDVGVYRSFRMNELNKFPSEKELKKTLTEIVDEYKIKLNATKLDEPYMGPVLIVNGEVESVVNQMVNNLYSSPKTRYSNGNHYQNMQGVRVISKQLSIRMDNGDKAQNNKSIKRDLIPIDGQAVIPPDSIILVENGILKNMLTSRQPVKNFLNSNGNSKSGYGSNQRGVITFTGNEQYPYPEMKKMLIDEARLQGLPYTYIVNSDDKYHLKIDVETGEETPFLASINLGQVMKSMRRVMGVDSKTISSTDGTIRYPASILLEDAEITIYKSNNRLKKDFVARPKL